MVAIPVTMVVLSAKQRPSGHPGFSRKRVAPGLFLLVDNIDRFESV
jgi:hypothetical protein